MSYKNLPGVQIQVVDRGLVSAVTPSAKSTLIVGTAAQGPINQYYQVSNLASAAKTFGFQGDLFKAACEVASYSDNVILFRMGATQASLSGIGAQISGTVTPGFTITFGQVTPTTGTDYLVWYKAGILVVWYQGQLVYSNSVSIGLIDTQDININVTSISTYTGLQLGTGSTPSLSTAISATAAAGLTATSPDAAPVFTAAVTGLNLTGRQTFVAWRQAAELLQGAQVDQVYVPAAKIDAPNVAFYVSSDTTTTANNPATNADALDWLKTSIDNTTGLTSYQWAAETTDSNDSVVTAMSAATPALRLTAGFHEVNWGYDLAKFAAQTSALSNVCVALIGTSQPKSFKLNDVRTWLGALPAYLADNVTPASNGRGLLGIPYLTGTTSTKLNPLTADFASGYRLPGFFQTDAWEYDGGVDDDMNQNPIDIGSYLHVVADIALLTNNYASNYTNNIAGVVAGYLAGLDAKNALTNKQIRVTKIPGLNYTAPQLDSLTQANINVLKNAYTNAATQFPALLHDKTAATAASDYTLLLRVRIRGLVVATMLARANQYVGTGSIDGLTMQAMKTALDKDLTNLQTRGYISGATVKISASASDQAVGHANLYLQFNPANELVQLNAFVGIGQATTIG